MNENPYTKMTVLVADDSRSIREVLVAMLESEGVKQVLQAHDGESAMAVLENPDSMVDMVFCDLDMPGTDGVETMRRIAASRLAPAIALISGFDQKLLNTVSDMTRELGLRVVGTLNKPVTAEKVSVLLKEFLLSRRIYRSRQGFGITAEELDDGLKNNKVEVYYQPKVGLSDGKLHGVEALVRLHHPAFGLLDPDQFIPIAESSGRISALTMIVLEKAIKQGGEWHREGLDLSIAINMSVLAIRRLDLPELIAAMAAEAGFPNDHIIIELTESQIDSGPEILHIVSRFRLRNFRLSIDDYGTGQSGLQRLQRLPFTELKIDKAFVNGAHKDADMRSILEVSIQLGHRLRMEVVAEGVECWQDWQLLKSLGCDMAQGFVVAKPLPAAGISLWAKNWQAPPI